MPSFCFRAMQQPGSESASSSTWALPAGRMAEMSCNYAHEFDAPWFSGQAGHFSWEERPWSSKNRAALQSVRRERRGEKICHALRCSAPWFSCWIFLSFWLQLVGIISSVSCADMLSGMHAWSQTLHSSIRLPAFRLYTKPHDAVQHQRGKMVSSTLCVSNEMPGTFIFMMPQKGIHVNVRSITYVYLNSETIPPVLIQHHKESALCICVCVCVCVCLRCPFMIRERSAGPHMISRLEHKSLLVRGSLCLCFVQSLPYTMIYKEVHVLKVCMSAYLDHSHVQHKR
jgi:hypothetical protein